ncbi:MAG: hypothetical protein KA143_10560 [Saprospiraceae bacterium]|nr:hypothetical protein [Saprospiraceae bacterium]
MKYLFFVLIVIHAVIHTIGFSNAFNLARFDQFAQTISRTAGVIWFLSFVLLFLTGILFWLEVEMWWVVSVIAVVLSQYLIVSFWADAKWGTIPNILIFVFTTIQFFQWNFRDKYDADVRLLLNEQSIKTNDLLLEQDIQHLPELVRKYIRYTNSIDKPKVKNFHVRFSGEIRKNENSEWMKHNSEQYSSLLSGTRLFLMTATMKKLPVMGYHRYKSGHASMDIKLFSIFRVQYQEGPQMDMSETVTFLNDICLMAPAALIEPIFGWGKEEGNKVEVFLSLHGIKVSAWLHFNNEGQLINFISEDRFAYEEPDKMTQVTWSTPVSKYSEMNGYTLATEASAIYHYLSKPLTYATFRISHLDYNLQKENQLK